ncbi:8674_t:CDS:2 [Funneliformis geosporum]|uniref:17513_t:CDS:1 n=1 Tax=Funneliformis geosporum TaxID=1117311 RepID=A0A9W4WK77_9GLOM|nr:17513_t:CDS:2 [Funneliformis geosporum]CAI2171035.1 8674_t:CDS:2 [Funneliformis geosporum]
MASHPQQPPEQAQAPNSAPNLVSQLLRRRQFFEQENSQVKYLDDTSISSDSTVYLRLCEDMEYVVNGVCTKIMIEECKDLKLTVNEKIITSIIEIWKSDGINIKLNSQVQTVQIDQCKNINLEYDKPSKFHSIVWTNTSHLSMKIYEDGQEKHSLNAGDEILVDSSDDKLYPSQYIVRLIDNQLVTEDLVRAEKGFPTTQREWDEWKAKIEINSERSSNIEKILKDLAKGNANDDING